MFLRELHKRIPQVGYEGKISLIRIQKLSYETIEDRFNLLINVLSYTNSLGMFLYDGDTMFVPYKIDSLIARALSYSTTNKIVGSVMAELARLLSYEFIKQNGNQFDYKVFESFLKGKAEFNDFISTDINGTAANVIWQFSGKEKIYNGKGLGDLMSLKSVEINDILSNIIVEDVEVQETIDFILDKKNDAILKKEFRNLRTPGLQILKYILNPIVNKTRVIDFVKKQS